MHHEKAKIQYHNYIASSDKINQQNLIDCKCGWIIDIIKPTKAEPGFHVRPWCWIVERTFGWLNKNRRLSKDYEGLTQTCETLIQIAMIRIMARKLALEG